MVQDKKMYLFIYQSIYLFISPSTYAQKQLALISYIQYFILKMYLTVVEIADLLYNCELSTNPRDALD